MYGEDVTDRNTEDPAGRKRIGPYRLIGELGRGGMGVVYRAEHVDTGEAAALKTVLVCRERQVAGIRREIRLLAGIEHPGIVRIRDEGVIDGKPWYAMELVEGTTLDHYCSEIIWDSAPFSRHWTNISERHFATRESLTDRAWWEKLLGTTVDSLDPDIIREGSQGLETIKVPAISSKPQIPAAGGHLPEVLTLFYRICQSLAYLHGKGIVHRDLKPGNIFIREDGFPVIMDFGLTAEFWRDAGREDLESAGISGGTLLYIPPEQISGNNIDARTDLYSLGCMLYEFVTGQLPFMVTSPIQAIQAHMKLVPIPPSSLVHSLPVPLNDLILKLLKKEPYDRIGHADGVALILAELGADTHYPFPLPRPRAYLYRSRFKGRTNLLKEITERIDALESGTSGALFIGGEGGVGKTRLLQEVWRIGKRRHIRVFSGECLPGSVGGDSGGERVNPNPLTALRKTFVKITEYCLDTNPDERTRILGERAAILVKFFPEMHLLTADSAMTEPPPLGHDAARMRLFDAMLRTLEEFSRIEPILLLLDDLQWADEVTRDFLVFLLRTGLIRRFPLLITGTYRMEETSEALERLVQSKSARSFELPCLDEDAIGEMVSDMLAKPTISESFIRFLARFSDGNPLLVSEYLRSCVDENLLFRDAEGHWQITPEGKTLVTDEMVENLPIPKTLLTLFNRRLDLLSDAARELSAIAAVIGRKIDMMLLWNIVSFQSDVLDAMDELIRCRILEESVPGTLHFLHDIIHTLTYERIGESRRRQLHRRVAEAIETVFPAMIDDDPAAFARHWEFSGNTGKARQYYLAAARKSVSGYALDESAKFYRKYFSLCDEITHEMVVARNEFGRDVLRLQGRPDAAFRAHRRALRDARRIDSPVDVADSIIGLTQYQVISGHHRRARVLLEKCLEIYREQDLAAGESKTLKRLGFIAMREGDFALATRLLTEALAANHRIDDKIGEASVLSDFGYLLYKENKWDEALAYHKKALMIQRDLGNPHLEARNLKNVAMVYLARGDYPLAESFCREALAITRRIGERNQEGQLLYQLAGINQAMGNLENARDLYENSLKIRSEYGDRLGEGMILEKLGDLVLSTGHLIDARSYFESAINLFESLELPHYGRRSLLGIVNILRNSGNRLMEAETLIEKAAAYAGKVNDQIVLCRCECERGHLAIARGDSPAPALENIRRICAEHHLTPSGPLQDAIQSLEQAAAIQESVTGDPETK